MVSNDYCTCRDKISKSMNHRIYVIFLQTKVSVKYFLFFKFHSKIPMMFFKENPNCKEYENTFEKKKTEQMHKMTNDLNVKNNHRLLMSVLHADTGGIV